MCTTPAVLIFWKCRQDNLDGGESISALQMSDFLNV